MPRDDEVARYEVAGCVLQVVRGDLTAQAVDAVVNAANEHLSHGGGVAAALARAGGPTVQADSDRWVAEHGPVGPGRAAVTAAGNLQARVLVHVVGPRYRAGQDNEGMLRQAVRAALDAARGAGASSVALPAISAGIFGYPPDDASRVIADEVVRWLGETPGTVTSVRLVGYDETAARRFAMALPPIT